MNRKAKFSLVVLILAGALVLQANDGKSPTTNSLPEYDANRSASGTFLGHEILFSVPIGGEGITYNGLMHEQAPWGPSALKVDRDGDFWIADAAANRLLEYDGAGNQLSVVDVSALPIVNITDFALAEDELFIFDGSAQEPAVFRMDYSGNILGRSSTPDDKDGTITGIRLDSNNRLLIETLFGEKHFSTLAASGSNSVVSLGREIRAAADLTRDAVGKSLTLSRGLSRRTETFLNRTGGYVLLDRDVSRNVFVQTSEIGSTPEGAIAADLLIHKYDASLGPRGVARIPLSERFVVIDHSIAMGPDGSLYHLLGTRDSVYVLKLRFFSSLPGILQDGTSTRGDQGIPADSHGGDLFALTTSCVYRSTMVSRASAYTNNLKSLTTTNISGACTGRVKPRYLGSAGTYSSVSYDWGGFDTVSGFNSYMTSGYKAGDIDSTAESCSRGVDCSGFVSRVWGLSSKYSTRNVSSISTKLSSIYVLQRGDIVSKYDVHMAMFYAYSGTTSAVWYESTTANSYDGVVRRTRPLSDFKYYTPYRYLSVCN